jgi:uncharacterized membrane protein YdbT with pleckstrin-like domain
MMSRSSIIKIIVCVLIILLNVIITLTAIKFYSFCNNNNSIINACYGLKDGQTYDGKRVKGIVLDYNFTIRMSNNTEQDYSGSEIYYLHNGELVSASEFIRGE